MSKTPNVTQGLDRCFGKGRDLLDKFVGFLFLSPFLFCRSSETLVYKIGLMHLVMARRLDHAPDDGSTKIEAIAFSPLYIGVWNFSFVSEVSVG